MFDIPKSEQKITKEFLLSKYSEETYMQTYLKIPVKKGLQISPLRNDKRPTASFYRNRKGELIFHDFGIGFHNNFIGVVMYLHNCSYYKALNIIASDFGLIEKCEKPNIKIKISDEKLDKKEDTSIKVVIKEFSKKELDWWNSFGISKKTLEKFKVFSCEHVFLNDNYFDSSSDKNMIFGYYGGVKNDVELWRIYFPQKKVYRFISNWPSKIIQGVKQLPKKLDSLVLTKSLKDVMALYELGIPAIAPCSENIIISSSQMFRLVLKYKHIYLLWDNDLPGVKAANKYRKLYPFIKCIFIKRKYSKDISDLHKKRGVSHFLDTISEFKDIIENNVKQTKHFYLF